MIGTCLLNYGSFMMKRELEYLPRIGSESLIETVRAFLNCRPWLAAQGLGIAGAWTHNVAVGLAPLSVVQPINASGICLLVILAITKLKEKAALVDWVGIGSILGGVLLLGISLAKTPGKETTYNAVLLWFFIILMFVVAVSSLWAAFYRKDERMSSFLGIGVGMLVGLVAVLTKVAWADVAARWAEYRIAGFVFSFYFWTAIVLTIVSMVMFQIALQRGMAIIVVPLVTAFSNLIPIFVGFIAFHEPFPEGAVMSILRLLSILLIIGGAILLSLRKGAGATS